MNIEIRLTKDELEETGRDPSELSDLIIKTLDNSLDLPAYNVYVKIIEKAIY